MKKAVLFDLDGTLVNSLEDLADATNYVLLSNGYQPHETERYKYFVGDGIPMLIKRALPSGASKEEAERCTKQFLEYYSLHFADKTRSYEGIDEVLDALRQRGIKTAVVSNKQQSMATLVVEKIYGNKLDAVIGKREALAPKPSSDMLNLACEELGVLPSECVFVGDSGVDMSAALNAEIKPIGVLWGFRDAKELKSMGAEYLCGGPSELLECILKL